MKTVRATKKWKFRCCLKGCSLLPSNYIQSSYRTNSRWNLGLLLKKSEHKLLQENLLKLIWKMKEDNGNGCKKRSLDDKKIKSTRELQNEKLLVHLSIFDSTNINLEF